MSRKLICWDSAIFIDWLRDEKSTNPERIPRIQSVIESMGDGRCRLLASILVYVEVLENATPGGNIGKFHDFIENREMVRIIPVDRTVAKKAQDIRNRAPKKISVPDAVHLATAIATKADMLQTFDKRLLSLNGASEVDGLVIMGCDIP